MKKIVSSAFLLLFITNVFSQEKFSIAGKWLGKFPLQDGKEIPFIFEIINNKNQASLFFINDTEKYPGGKVVRMGDTLFIALDQFDNEIVFGINKNQTLSGYFRKQNKIGIPSLVTASKNLKKHGVIELAPIADITGKYAVEFTNDIGKKVKSVGLFKQKGNELSATFLRVSGDSRYSFGDINGNRFNLSVFIGAGPLLFTGTINNEGTIIGEQIGLKSKQTFIAIKDVNAVLPSSKELTLINTPDKGFNFSFKNIQGKTITLNDPRYLNKPVIITIGGTWCPNCADEAMLLSKWYKNNKQRGIEIVTIQFEVENNFEYAQKTMRRFKQKFDIQYEMVFGGISENAKVVEAITGLEKFYGFPTTIFLDKNRNITKIHTGFSGPATGKYYDQFIKEFNEEVNKLLQ